MKVIFQHLYCIKRVHLWIKGPRFALKAYKGSKISRKLGRLQIVRRLELQITGKLDEIIKTKKEKIWEELYENVHGLQSRSEGKLEEYGIHRYSLC
jgi:hypothetical protein